MSRVMEAEPVAVEQPARSLEAMREHEGSQFALIKGFFEQQPFRKGAIVAATASLGLSAAALSPRGVEEALAYPTAEQSSVPSGTNINITDKNVKVNAVFAGKNVSVADIGKVKVLTNISATGFSRKVIARAQDKGDCFWGGKGTKRPWMKVQGYNVNNRREMGWDNRRSKFCYINGKLFRVLCKNPAATPKQIPEKRPTPAIFVNNNMKASLLLKAEVDMHAIAECRTSDGQASARSEIKGHGISVVKMSLRSFARAKGKGQLIQTTGASAEGKAIAELEGKASAVCAEKPAEVTPQPPTPPPPQPPTPNAPPSVDLVDQQHNTTDSRVQVCAVGRDQDNDIVYQDMTESGDGNFVTNIYAGDEPGEFCRDFAPGTAEGTVSITALVRDSAGQQASETETWPIVNKPF